MSRRAESGIGLFVATVMIMGTSQEVRSLVAESLASKIKPVPPSYRSFLYNRPIPNRTPQGFPVHYRERYGIRPLRIK